jgi:hypothetical protein
MKGSEGSERKMNRKNNVYDYLCCEYLAKAGGAFVTNHNTSGTAHPFLVPPSPPSSAPKKDAWSIDEDPVSMDIYISSKPAHCQITQGALLFTTSCGQWHAAEASGGVRGYWNQHQWFLIKLLLTCNLK